MEDDRQKPYSVLTRDGVKGKMKKQIDAISEVFLVPQSDAAVLLIYLRWDSLRVSECLTEDKDKLLTEAGLKSVGMIDSNQDLSDSSFDEFYEFGDDVDDQISTPLCSHKFSTSYWSEYLEKNFISLGKTQSAISCPDQDCRTAVGPDTIGKLAVRDQEMYDGYVLRSYLEGVKKEMIKQCPAPGCNYVVKFRQASDVEEYGLNVVCLCGHIFCWRCSLESHRPVTCNNASDWLSRDFKTLSDKSLSFSWIESNTKPCPHCLCPVELDGFNNCGQFLTCACSGRFCWKCLQPQESHTIHQATGVFGFRCVKPEIQLGSRAQVGNLCVDRWKEYQVSMEEAKSNLRAFEESIIKMPSILTEEYIKIMREGLMLIAQCRQVLKWSCVYGYLHTEYETSKKEYLHFLQENASALVKSYSETLKEETETNFTAAATFEGLSCFRSKSATATSSIGNYFYHFIKSLQEGLADVKVRSYDNFAGPVWLCDRCTFGNTWLDMGCKMCFDPTASRMEEGISDLSLN